MDNATKQLLAILKDYKDPIGWHPKLRPEREATSAKQLCEMKLLLQSGADWRAHQGQDDAPFQAAFFEDPRPLALLLEHGVPVDHTNPRRGNGTLLHHAAAFGRKLVIQLLADHGASPIAVDAAGKTPLDVARAWKHGADGLPLLTRLTKAALKQQPRATAGDLRKQAVLGALASKPQAFSKTALRGVEKFAQAAFAVGPGTTWEQFLSELGDQPSDEVVAAGLWVVATASTAKPSLRKQPGGELSLVHLGDLTVAGDCDAVKLLVTGSLVVKGRLTNWEGRGVYVGGSLRADAVVTEGPLWVQGDATVKRAMLASYNDYRATIVGQLSTPILVEDDHVVELGSQDITKHYRSRAAVPSAEGQRLIKILGLRKW